MTQVSAVSSQSRCIRHCMLVHAYYPIGEVRVERQVGLLRAAGFDVDVICLRKARDVAQEVIDGTRVFRLPVARGVGVGAASQLWEYLRFLVLAFFKLWGLTREGGYDTIQVHAPPDFLVMATLLQRLAGTRIILDIHDLMPEFYLGRFKKTRASLGYKVLLFQEKLAILYSHQIVTVTEEWRQRLIERGVPADKVAVVMNLPDKVIFSSRPTEPKGEGKTVFYHGALQERYGIDLLIRAIDQLRRDKSDIRLIIHGRGGCLASLQKLVADLGLLENVTFDTHLVPIEKLPAIILQADVAVVPYRDDPFTTEILPTKLMEYAALGIPVVAARTRVIPRYFDDSMVEFFSPENVDELSECLLRLLADGRSRGRLGQQIGGFFKKYNWEQESEGYLRTVGAGASARF